MTAKRMKAAHERLISSVTQLERGANGGCPMVQLLDALAGKWSFPILYRMILEDRPVRFRELQRLIGRITQKELTKHLRSFEQLGLVRRQVFSDVPPRVEYSITAYGKTLKAPLAALARWSVKSGELLFLAKAQAHERKQRPSANTTRS